MPTFTDDFNRANGALGAPWTVHSSGGCVISGNALVLGGTPANGQCTVETGAASGDLQVKIVAGPSNGFRFPFRLVNNQNYISWGLTSGVTYYVNFAGTTLSPSFVTTAAVDDVLRVRLRGASIECYKNDVLQGVVGCGWHLNATKHGVQGSSGPVTVDDFSFVPADVVASYIVNPVSPMQAGLRIYASTVRGKSTGQPAPTVGQIWPRE